MYVENGLAALPLLEANEVGSSTLDLNVNIKRGLGLLAGDSKPARQLVNGLVALLLIEANEVSSSALGLNVNVNRDLGLLAGDSNPGELVDELNIYKCPINQHSALYLILHNL